MRVNPHLTFKGDCEAAFSFYERFLGGRIEGMITYGASASTDEILPAWRGKILHATIALGDSELAGSDVRPDHYQPPSGFFVLLSVADPAEARRMFEALADKGTVRMPLQETFWSVAFGVVVDQFGIPWEINCTESSGAAYDGETANGNTLR